MTGASLPFALALTCSMCAFSPVARADAPKPAKAAEHLKVLVLDVNSTDLTASEKTTLTNLEAAHLSEDGRLDVLSGEDLKQLVTIQGQAAELGVGGKCTDACMAELAGALGAGVVIATQAGKLGDTLVVTLAVFDAAQAKSVSRKSLTAMSLGELPDKLGPALDALVKPLLPTTVAMVTTPIAPPMAPPSTRAAPAAALRPELAGRVKELYDAEAMQICVDAKDRSAWWFCDTKQSYTENAFVRKYRDVTGAHDVDKAEINRAGPGASVLPWVLVGVGVVGAAVTTGTLTCGLTDVCPLEVHDLVNISDNNGFGVAGFTLGVVGGILGTTLGITFGTSSFPSDADVEGTPQAHSLTEGEGRGAAARFNDALRDKLARDLGAG